MASLSLKNIKKVYPNIEEALISQRELRDRGYETLIVKNDVDN